ncbi:proto-oncogene Mas-like [Lissotriton helveticus]
MAGIGNLTLNYTDLEELNQTALDNSTTSFIIAASFILLISLFGIIGNSVVFWYLSFKIKSTSSTIYIINLAVADLIYLIFVSIVMCITISLFVKQEGITNPLQVFFALEIIMGLANYADMFIRLAISLERCIVVHYPIRCSYKRQKVRSTLVCVLIWGVSILVTLVDNLGCPPELFGIIAERCTAVQIFLSVLVLLVSIPIMLISSLILLLSTRRTSMKSQSSRLIIIIVATIFVFLLSVAPMRVLWLSLYLQLLPSSFFAGAFFFTVYLVISINSSVNPFIYYLVGRHNMKGIKKCLETALKKAFRDEEGDDQGEEASKDHEMENTTYSEIS